MTDYELRLKRINDAISLTEPDRVPITDSCQCYGIYNAGYTVADVVYDFDKHAEAAIKFARQYEPDAAGGGITIPGQGQIMELLRPKNLVWPGAPDGRIDRNSTQQFIEYPVLLEEDMDFFMKDYTGWLLKKGYPAIMGLFEPIADWELARFPVDAYNQGLIGALSTNHG